MNKLILDEIKRHEEIIADLKKQNSLVDMLYEIVKPLPENVFGNTFYFSGDVVNARLYNPTLEEIKAIIKAVGEKRYFLKYAPIDVEDTKSRIWVFSHKETKQEFNLIAQIIDSKSCKWVETGKKVVPIMELVCE